MFNLPTGDKKTILPKIFSAIPTPFIVCLLFLSGVSPASASYTDESFLFRMFFSLDRQNNSASGLGRQASLAFIGGASINPAARGWDVSAKDVASITYIDANSQSDARIIATPLSININKPSFGSFFCAYAHTETQDESGKDNLDQSLDSDEFWLSYSRRTSDKTSFGVQIKYTDADIKNEFFNMEWGGLPGRIKTSLKSYDLNLGVLTQLNNTWYAGFSGTYSLGTTKNKLINVNDLYNPISNSIIPSGMTLSSVNDDYNFTALRVGVGYKPQDKLGLYADFHQLFINSDQGGSAETQRTELGVEYQGEILRYRAGLSLDSDSEISKSIGLGCKFNSSDYPIIIDMGYQWNTAPEIRSEFGRFDILSITASMAF